MLRGILAITALVQQSFYSGPAVQIWADHAGTGSVYRERYCSLSPQSAAACLLLENEGKSSELISLLGKSLTFLFLLLTSSLNIATKPGAVA